MRRVRAEDGVFGALAMALCVRLMVQIETCCWESVLYLRNESHTTLI